LPIQDTGNLATVSTYVASDAFSFTESGSVVITTGIGTAGIIKSSVVSFLLDWSAHLLKHEASAEVALESNGKADCGSGYS
jgi:hypothetical protein